MPEGITFQSIITPAGAFLAATGVKLAVDLLKAVLPRLDAAISGALLAFILSGVLYLAAALSLPSLGVTLDANGYLNVVIEWITCAAVAIGITGAISHARFTSGAVLLTASEPVRYAGTLGETTPPPA